MLQRVSGRVRKAVNQPVGQDFGSAPPLSADATSPAPHGSRTNKRKRLRRHSIGTLLAQRSLLSEFAFPAVDHNRRAGRTRAGGLRLPGFTLLATLAVKTRAEPLLLTGP